MNPGKHCEANDNLDRALDFGLICIKSKTRTSTPAGIFRAFYGLEPIAADAARANQRITGVIEPGNPATRSYWEGGPEVLRPRLSRGCAFIRPIVLEMECSAS